MVCSLHMRAVQLRDRTTRVRRYQQSMVRRKRQKWHDLPTRLRFKHQQRHNTFRTRVRRKQHRDVRECHFGHGAVAFVVVADQTTPIEQKTFVQGT